MQTNYHKSKLKMYPKMTSHTKEPKEEMKRHGTTNDQKRKTKKVQNFRTDHNNTKFKQATK